MMTYLAYGVGYDSIQNNHKYACVWSDTMTKNKLKICIIFILLHFSLIIDWPQCCKSKSLYVYAILVCFIHCFVHVFTITSVSTLFNNFLGIDDVFIISKNVNFFRGNRVICKYQRLQ